VLTFVAHWEAEAEHGDFVADQLLELSTRSLAEPGCLVYEPSRDRDHPNRFVLYEQYQDDEALEAHRDSAHFRQIVLEGIGPVLVERRVQVLIPLDATTSLMRRRLLTL
jgi:autoinducer 2-degrading protein